MSQAALQVLHKAADSGQEARRADAEAPSAVKAVKGLEEMWRQDPAAAHASINANLKTCKLTLQSHNMDFWPVTVYNHERDV